MLNSIILVGRLVDTPTLKLYNDSVYAIVTLAVNRPFKNLEGETETDFISCITWDVSAKATCDYCRKGDIVAVRGRLITKTSEINFSSEDDSLKKKITNLEVIAERVVFINTTGTPENASV